MPKIKWVGVIKGEVSDYQEGELAKTANKMVMPATVNEMMIKAVPFLVLPFVILFLSMFIKTYLSHQVVVNPLFIFIGFIAGVLGLLVHELLHAIVYPKEATVYIGIYPKAFAAVALASYPLKRGRYILMSLLPVVLGLVPIVIFMLAPPSATALNGFLFGFAMMGLVSPYPDYYNVYQVIKQTPKKCHVQFYGDDVYWIE